MRPYQWRNAIGVIASSLAGTAIAQMPAATPAGTSIVNVGQLVFTSDGTERQAESNAVALIVAERLDVALARVGTAVTEITPAPVAIPLVLTNAGSGREAFALAADSSTPAVVVRGVAIDRDGDGRYDPAVDAMPVTTTPPLAPGEAVKLLAIVASANDADDGAATGGVMTLTARALTGSGATDTVYARAGDDGGDAVVGPTGAIATISAPFAGATAAMPTLVKTQTVRAPDGSATAVGGAIVTYALVAHFPAGPIRSARIDDPLPAATTYVPGTLTLDGKVLTDAADDDPGSVAAGRVTVALGPIDTATVHDVRFQVRLP